MRFYTPFIVCTLIFADFIRFFLSLSPPALSRISTPTLPNNIGPHKLTNTVFQKAIMRSSR